MLRLWIVLLLAGAGLRAQGNPFDILIRGARVVDGSGSPWFYADLGIRGDTIAEVGDLSGARSAVTIEARGMVVAPGFIDIHSHGRRGIGQVPTAENYLREGVTTIIEGPDGSSPLPIADFLGGIRKTPISVNFATFVGQGSIRQAVIGSINREATPEEIVQDEGDGRSGDARGRVRPLYRTLLRPWQFHTDRRSDRARQGGRQDGRHPHLTHARGGVARARQRARDHPHRRGGRTAHADHAPQDDRPAELGAERGIAQAGGSGARPRGGRHYRSVPVHRIEHRHRRPRPAMGAGRRAEGHLRTPGRARAARTHQEPPSCKT